MIRIIVINAKGGCGKSTVTTNLASFYASKGFHTALYDYDEQGSSMRWLETRPSSVSKIHGVSAHKTASRGVTRSWHMRIPPEISRLVIDTPPGLKGPDLANQIKDADFILIPVLPAWLDICATGDFLRELIAYTKLNSAKARVAIIANKARKNTTAFNDLDSFLKDLNIPVLAQLRDTQNYNRYSKLGLGVHELKRKNTEKDRNHWQSIFNWIEINAENRSISGEFSTGVIPQETRKELIQEGANTGRS